MKSVFTFSSSRDFLRAYIESLPKKGWGEIQRWADHLGVQTSYVSQVLSGMKTFNVEYSVRLAKHIGLSGLELDYFVLLIEKERAGSVEAQDYFDEKLQRLKKDSRNLAERVTKACIFRLISCHASNGLSNLSLSPCGSNAAGKVTCWSDKALSRAALSEVPHPS